ncbi:2-hydroxymuconate tautomerase [Vagococcus salmoninarum]|uniref:Tautomerase n=1 Tax=Vagococcus salmoninarum TaxID=2739 RepID=A0A429ZKF5_9ENTE|nr:2-hydroxymuconate tautomerase [Vagococcus salmoninarum]RST94161.1 4-oxalocrotonate tautomerase [Vagococcus salmoninarum]
MPIINIQMLAGRTPEQKAGLIKDVTAAVVKNTGASPEAVSIIISDMEKENYGLAGKVKK